MRRFINQEHLMLMLPCFLNYHWTSDGHVLNKAGSEQECPIATLNHIYTLFIRDGVTSAHEFEKLNRVGEGTYGIVCMSPCFYRLFI